MFHKTAATVAHTIGIDTGKNILHLIGLDDQGAIGLDHRQWMVTLPAAPRALRRYWSRHLRSGRAGRYESAPGDQINTCVLGGRDRYTPGPISFCHPPMTPRKGWMPAAPWRPTAGCRCYRGHCPRFARHLRANALPLGRAIAD
jgi:hypothetical protein